MSNQKEESEKPSALVNDLSAIFPKVPQPVKWEDTEGHDRFPDVYQIKKPNELKSWKHEGRSVTFICENGIVLNVQVLNNHIWRFRYAIDGDFAWDHSYAVDPKFATEEAYLMLEELSDSIRLVGRAHHVIISKANAAIRIEDTRGEVLCQDQHLEIRSTILKGITEVKLNRQINSGEIFYGLGDKSCSLNLRGKKFENWNTDAFGYHAESDPLYRTVPFYYGLQDGKAYGVFFDNTHRTWFDFDEKKQGQFSMSADAGEMNFYFIGGPQLMDVATRYANLTGKSDLPPIWGLGFHQCRWSYYPESRVREIAAQFRKRRIPCDAIYLDIDYMQGYRCFTINEDHFPDMGKMVGDLREDGFHTIVMIDPGIRTDPEYHVFAEGKERDYFCRRKDGTLMRGPVWPEDCAFPDYTKEEVRIWWGQLYKKLYLEQGISGFWNDMNEPAVFKVNSATFPDDVRHDYEGHGAEHARIHNIYGQQMVKATQEGLLRLQPNKRPIVITRASYAGGQRYSSSWTGDNVASWEHLAIANRQCQRMSISGFSYIGTDIGGFVDQPSGELLVRWLQLAVFHPLYRIHSMGNNEDGAAEADADRIAESERLNRMDQEPWAFGNRYEDLAREAIELRYELLPYVYSSFWQHSTYGVPVLRQLAFYDQHDPQTLLREDEFMFGDHLLAVNIHQPNQFNKKIYLPKGKWIDYWTKEEFIGGNEYDIKISVHHIPIFVKAGSIIPQHKVRQSTSEKIKELQLHLYASPGEFTQEIFEDAGEGFEFKDQGHLIRNFDCSIKENSLQLNVQRKGHFQPAYETIKLNIHNLGFKPISVQVDNQEKSFQVDEHFGNVFYVVELKVKTFSKIELH